MQKDILYRFFDGNTTIDEEQQIRQWLAQSKENKSIFMQERLAYDTSLFVPSSSNENKIISKSKISPWIISNAVAVALLLIISSLYIINTNTKSNQYNTILVPPGQRINLILADQTNVWLNANTKFEYPSQFSRKNRTVHLDGEAYFDVAQNKKKPFIVKTSTADVEVTGTKFNVEAYSRTNKFETSLFEGGVDIYIDNEKLTSLKPNEKGLLINNDINIEQITDTDEYLWRRGLIAFNNKSLEEILLALEKYFDIDIKMDSSKLPTHTYSGKFRQADGVDYALRVLQRSINFSYERDDDTNTIYIK